MLRRDFIKGIVSTTAALSGLAAAGELFIPFAEALDVPSFRFAHITDLHLDVRGDSTWQYRQKSVPLFIDALQQVVRLPKLRFLVFGGDQVHYGPNDRESMVVFRHWIRQLQMPIYILLGNTEVSPVEGVSTLGREEYLAEWSGRGLGPNRSSWGFDPVPGVRVIGWDVTVDGKPYGEAAPPALTWLRRELHASRDRSLVILFTHHPLLPTTELDADGLWRVWMVKNHEEVRALLKRYPNVRLAVSGHHHATRVQTVGRPTFVSDPGIVTYPCAFRMYTVDRGGISLKLIGLDDQETVARARELLVRDPYARIYDPAAPERAAEYSAGLSPQDRESVIRL